METGREEMAGSYRSVRVVYDGTGTDILWWCISTVVFSLITLGLYLPVAVNRLVRYIFDNTELVIQEVPASGEAGAVSDATSPPTVA
jgi:uncharacterized membrane protein YjgN (DUF898 family)